MEIKEVEGQGPGDEGSQDAKVVEDVDTLPHYEGFGEDVVPAGEQIPTKDKKWFERKNYKLKIVGQNGYFYFHLFIYVR